MQAVEGSRREKLRDVNCKKKRDQNVDGDGQQETHNQQDPGITDKRIDAAYQDGKNRGT